MTCQKDALEKKQLMSERGKLLNSFIKNLTYREKVSKSLKEIRGALREHGKKPVISSSFGKDSMVLTHLIHSINPIIPIVFTRTGQQFPETIRYMEAMRDMYDCEVFELTPEQSFWDIVKDYGYPRESRNSKKGDAREPHCCKILKFKPMEKFIKEWKPTLNFVGLIGDEGRQRRMNFIMRGSATYFMKTLGLWKSTPLLWWTESEIWRYHDENAIPRNPVYEKYGISRTGCMACTGHLRWRETMQKVSFQLYRKVSQEMGQPLIESFAGVGK